MKVKLTLETIIRRELDIIDDSETLTDAWLRDHVTKNSVGLTKLTRLKAKDEDTGRDIATSTWSNDFLYKDSYVSTGDWVNDKWDINYCGLLTRLIQEAGTICDAYASDLFISWREIEDELRNPAWKGGVYWFGFRERGVDHEAYIKARDDETTYKSLWKLQVDRHEDRIRMQLKKVPTYEEEASWKN